VAVFVLNVWCYTFPKRGHFGKDQYARCKKINEKTGCQKEASSIVFGKVALTKAKDSTWRLLPETARCFSAVVE